ncbi:MAG TPA: amino acid adenylation domain-containing protein [Candidatus Sulfotelmatobacter sp.]
MSKEVQNIESTQERISRLTPAQRAMLEKRLRGEARPDQSKESGIQRRPTLDYSMTAEQEHLWLLQQVDPTVYYFNHTHAYLLKGELNVAALERAINEMVRRHENFRTSMPEVGGQPRAVVAPQLQILLERVDVPEFPVEDQRDRLQALITAGTCRPFDILNSPLIRATLYRVSEREHAIQVTLHHLITDFVSYDLFDYEMFTLYDAFARGLPSPLPELTVQYGDFAAWLNQWMQSDEAARQADYWLRKLADLPRLDLVTDMPRPRLRSFDGVRIPWTVPERLWLQFKQVALTATVTRFTAFLALFGMLLREYSGSDDIPIATPVSSRKHRETQPLIGYFLNTIVYRLDLSGDPTFRELLERTRVVTLEAMANSDLPFEFLMNKLGAERDPSRAPLVDSSYAFGNDHKPASAPGGLVLEEFDTYYRSAWLDINLGVNDNTDHALVGLDYLTALFLPSTAERMMLHFQRLFAQAVEDPDRRLGSFSLLCDVEQQQILAEWNDTAAPYPSTQTIPVCFAMQVAQAGNAVALRSARGELTYRELNEQANRLAHRLIKSGVAAETPVAILMERSPEMVVATLAVLKAGGAYLPLHSAYPLERMRLIMEEAGAAVLLLDRSSADRGLTHPNVIVVNEDPSLPTEQDADPNVRIHTDQLAYVIYTSGSTGTPKGVAVTHGNVLSLAFDSSWGEGSLDRVLFHSSHAFDASTYEMWSALLRGKQVIISPPGELDIATYKRLFQEEKITSTFLTASLFNALVQEAPDCFLGAREIWAGGDVVPVAAVQRLREYCPETLVCNGYGPTETTTFATHYAAANPENLTGSVPIGAPMDNHQVYVLNSALQPVAVGIPGELFIAGAGLARGYLNRPDLTAGRFLPNPFGRSGERMYRTGDRVRWREDGQVEFLGRTDQQVKVRGYRIELAEIETALMSCSDVGQVAVLVREDRAGEKKLVAYVVPALGYSINAAELRKSLTLKLPDYMVPSFIKVLPSLPLNSNGKLDRKALPTPEVTGTGARRAPRTRAEEVLCSLLKELLAVPEVSPDDNFFSLGGDSILAIQLVSRARQAALIVTLRNVFQQPGIEALAAVSHFAQKSAAAPVENGVGPMPPTPIMCWFLEHGGSLHRFSQSMLLQVPADVKHEHLVLALQIVLDCHDALRLRFTGAEGDRTEIGREEWKLEIQPKGAVSAASCLRAIDLQGIDTEARQKRIEEEAQAAQTRLSAERGIMLQAVWFDAGRFDADTPDADPTSPGRLLLTIHHLSIDGVSWRILLPDLAACVAAIAAGTTPVLEPSPVSFRGWAQRLNQEALNPERVKELSFWTDTLKGASELLPGYKLDPGRDTLSSTRQSALTLPASVTAPLLSQVAATFHARINDVLLAGFVLSILNWRRRNSREGTSVLIDLEGHGREAIVDDLDLSRTVGFFTTIFPVRLDLGSLEHDSLDPDSLDLEEAWAGGKALGQAVKSIKEQLGRVPSNGIGYGLLRYLNPETASALSDLPESQIDFNYLGRFPVTDTGHWSPCELLAGGMDPDMPFHHSLEVDSMVLEHSSGPELTATWTWLPAAFSEQDIRLLAEGWFHVLEALVHHCAKPGMGGFTPSDLPLVALSQSEIERLESEYGEIQDILPLSPVQEGMLFHAFYDVTGPDIYNVQVLLTLEGARDEDAVDEETLQESVRALLRRHPNLRAAFKHQELARPVQIIPQDISLQFHTLDFSSLEGSECERRFAELVAKERVTRFQLDTSPLFRFHLVRCSTQRFRLLITTHHILIDGWSLPLMLRELLLLYAHHGSPAALAWVTPFRDYLAWLARQDRKASEAAWREALAGLEEGTRMSAAGSLREPKIPERLYVVLDEELTNRLTEQARARSLTLNNVIQGAWAVLLSRYTGRDDVVFGGTVSGRNPEINGIESMIGLLINTLPTRVQLRSGDSFNDLLSRLSQEQSALLPHQYLGLLEIQRITGLNELFDTLVVFENFPMNRVREKESFGGVRLTEIDTNDSTHYPLSVLVCAGQSLTGPDLTSQGLTSQGLTMGFEYQPDCFAGNFIDALSRRFVRLLEAYTGDPNQVLSCIDLLSEQERRQILVEFNQTHTEYPRDKTMMELFAEQVRRRGEEPAVTCGKERLSYAELDRRSNQLGRYLANLGVGPEKLVGISMERSVEVVLAMLAILKAGGAYVPIDPAYPPDRLRFMVEDSGIAVLLTKGRLAHPMPEIKAPVLRLDRDWDEVAQQSDQSFPARVFPENLAYVIYTSGSTGLPKATAVSHRSLIRLLRETNYIQFQGDEVVAQTVNLSFDPCTFEIWGSLLNGCFLVIIGNEDLLDVDRFAAEIKDKGVKVMFLATSLFNEMGRQNPAMFNSVKCLLFGGEAVHPGTAAAVLESGGPERLVNAYGPAECTTFTSCYLVQKVTRDAASVPIGKPVSNTYTYVLDRHMNLEPVGAMGHLYIGGEGLARGYWRRPELTAEKYLPNPYGEPGERMYCSGDLARWMQDGNLEFFGRADHQIKIRSFRVELGEIEVALLQHGGVRNCAVLMKTGASGKRLVAYVSGEASADELKSYLKTKLPEYMVPSVYVMLPELPLSTNGKVDHRALPDPAPFKGRSVQDGASETMTAIEELLVDIWTQVLGATQVGVRDNFYDLGGESLLALRVVSRINKYFQTELSVRTLLEHPVLMDFAQKLRSISGRSVEELEKIAKVGLTVRRMTPEQRKAALAGH